MAMYTYNPDGLRRTKAVFGTLTQRYIWSCSSMVYECELLYPNNGTVYVYGINLISARNSSGDDIFYLYNAHGDVVQLVDGNGTIIQTYNYDAFGVEYDIDEDDDNHFRYAGQYFDFESGTYYLRARYYNPANGRFTQQDGWGYAELSDPISLNLYTYCHNNPIKYYDPTGHTGELTLKWSASMWWLCGVDFALPVGDIIYIAGMGAMAITDAINAIGIDNVVSILVEGTDAIKQAVEWVGDQIASAVDSVTNWFKDTFNSGNSTSPGDPDWNGGFKNFYQLKKHLGSPGKGNEWHHIVEQNQIDKSGFDPYSIHNINNVISVSKEAHKQISAYYSRVHDFTEGLRFRDWLVGQDFKTQYEWGLKVLRMYGVNI